MVVVRNFAWWRLLYTVPAYYARGYQLPTEYINNFLAYQFLQSEIGQGFSWLKCMKSSNCYKLKKSSNLCAVMSVMMQY